MVLYKTVARDCICDNLDSEKAKKNEFSPANPAYLHHLFSGL